MPLYLCSFQTQEASAIHLAVFTLQVQLFPVTFGSLDIFQCVDTVLSAHSLLPLRLLHVRCWQGLSARL